MSDAVRKKYKCAYCLHKEGQISLIVEHCVENHRCETLKYRELVLESESGLWRYQSKTHEGVVPIRLENEGKTIEVRGCEIFITRKTPKRKKLNTPVKERSRSSKTLTYGNSDKTGESVEVYMDTNQSYSAYKELIEILPNVLENLEEEGQLDSFVKYMRLLSKGNLPASNICYLLFQDLVEWYSSENTSTMRYRPETVKFWQIGYRLFHGNFLRFMSGPRHEGSLLRGQSEKGHYDPIHSKVNFAVPSKNHLYGKEKVVPILPSVCFDAIKAVSQVCEGKPMKLAVNGKKIRRGLLGL